jgi:hypothetical protein
MRSNISPPLALTKPTIQTLLRYLKCELSFSEIKQVEEAIEIYPECKDVLKGLNLLLKQYGVKSEEKLVESSVIVLSRIGKIQSKMESISETKLKFSILASSLMAPFQDKHVTPALIMGSGSITIAASFSISRGLLESISMFYMFYIYVSIITTIKLLEIKVKINQFEVWVFNLAHHFNLGDRVISLFKAAKNSSYPALLHLVHNYSSIATKIPRKY